jgi:MtN3 and saliva related transmembrane protein
VKKVHFDLARPWFSSRIGIATVQADTSLERVNWMQLDPDLIGYFAATLTTCAFIPQTIKTIRSRDTRAISFWMYLTFTVGIAFWFAYGVTLGSWPIMLSNTLSFLMALTILVMKMRYG